MTQRDDTFFSNFTFDVWEDEYQIETPCDIYWDNQTINDFCRQTQLQDIAEINEFIAWLDLNGHVKSEYKEGSNEYMLLYTFQPTWELLDGFKRDKAAGEVSK